MRLTVTIRNIVRAGVAVAAAAALSGCLVSETPLLDDANAKATPLAAGTYEACGEDKDCKTMKVTLEGVVYGFEPADDKASLGRFRSLGGGAYLAQMWEEGDGSYFYFYARPTKSGAKLAMIGCDEIPASTRAGLVKSGDLKVSGDDTTCTALTLKGAEKAARGWARKHGRGGDWTVLTRKAS